MKKIATSVLTQIDEKLREATFEDDGLLGGNLGLVLYFYQRYRLFKEARDAQKTHEWLEKLFGQLNNGESNLMGPSFANGLAGFNLVLTQLQQENFLDLDLDTELQELDQYLVDQMLSLIEEGDFDFLHGAMGILHYFITRLPHKGIQPHVEKAIQLLSEKAIEDEQGIRFIFKNHTADQDLNINLSLSHGMSGLLLVLLNAYQKGIQQELVLRLLNGGIQFMLKSMNEVDFNKGQYAFFPHWLSNDNRHTLFGNRMGWCYGDLNQTLLFYRAHQVLGDDQLQRMANLIGTHSLIRKTPKMTGVEDVYFCHGTAGLTQYYKTLYTESKITGYLKGYQYWLEQTLANLYQQGDDPMDQGLLTGDIGLALVLISAISTETPTWPKLLLL